MTKVRATIRAKLLRWYDRNRRDLPWRRRAADPYAQWVAEIMLQQTRVETVVEYYERFLKRFPTVRALADAEFEEVLKCWEGLGYYRRIHHLHQAARMLRDAGRGVPNTVEGLRELPGIGEYTAAAIASIAFGRPEAAVDGNVARVLSRIFGIRGAISSSVVRKRIAGLAAAMLPGRRPGDFNQAWMDLGSAICTPRSPDCPHCPLRTNCRTAQVGLAPRPSIRRPPQAVTLTAVVFRKNERMLVRRRPRGGLWSGLWEFPSVECPDGLNRTEVVKTLAKKFGLSVVGRGRAVGELRHQLTHRSLTFGIFLAEVRSHGNKSKLADDVRWVTVEDFEALPVSTAYRRIFARIKPVACARGSD